MPLLVAGTRRTSRKSLSKTRLRPISSKGPKVPLEINHEWALWIVVARMSLSGGVLCSMLYRHVLLPTKAFRALRVPIQFDKQPHRVTRVVPPEPDPPSMGQPNLLRRIAAFRSSTGPDPPRCIRYFSFSFSFGFNLSLSFYFTFSCRFSFGFSF